MRFEKYHGTGNDFVFINNLDGAVTTEEMPKLAERLCDRHFGIGADGLIAVKKVDGLYFMDYWNSDGSFAEMCGNGVRCTAHYIVKNIEKKNITELTIKTGDGDKKIELDYIDGELSSVKVNMGKPQFLKDVDVKIADRTFVGSYVSMGNPHYIMFDEELSDANVLTEGSKIENYTTAFENKTNVEFANVMAKNEISLRVWERGCGETLACGTGASATVTAGILKGLLDTEVVVHLPGGDLTIQWSGKENDDLYLIGPSKAVYTGKIEL